MFTRIILLVIILLIVLSVFVIARYKVTRAPQLREFYWLAVPSMALSIYSLCTCWIWIYYLALYICLPAYLAALLLIFLAYFKKRDVVFFKWTLGVQLLTLFVSCAAALWML